MNPHRGSNFPEVSAFEYLHPRSWESKIDKRRYWQGDGKGVDGKLRYLPQQCLKRAPLQKSINNKVCFRDPDKKDSRGLENFAVDVI